MDAVIQYRDDVAELPRAVSQYLALFVGDDGVSVAALRLPEGARRNLAATRGAVGAWFATALAIGSDAGPAERVGRAAWLGAHGPSRFAHHFLADPAFVPCVVIDILRAETPLPALALAPLDMPEQSLDAPSFADLLAGALGRPARTAVRGATA